ncbi:hypothetical protein BC835DRAFT_1307534 [Cytidiella melzeri]|nr:hypothetical protein BC835DRAFT_1307534 [Cytidiella melzeri]
MSEPQANQVHFDLAPYVRKIQSTSQPPVGDSLVLLVMTSRTVNQLTLTFNEPVTVANSSTHIQPAIAIETTSSDVGATVQGTENVVPPDVVANGGQATSRPAEIEVQAVPVHHLSTCPSPSRIPPRKKLVRRLPPGWTRPPSPTPPPRTKPLVRRFNRDCIDTKNEGSHGTSALTTLSLPVELGDERVQRRHFSGLRSPEVVPSSVKGESDEEKFFE